MILAYVADGPRDEATLPPLVRTATGLDHEAHFTPWQAISTHRGYDRKLRYALRRAKRDGHSAVIAVVDRDRSSGRLASLSAQREADRHLELPTAVGEANPHVDAWLTDDLVALRQVVGLDPGAKALPGKNPKEELNELIDRAGLDRLEALAALAAEVAVHRCRNAKYTGLAAFLDDCVAELAALSP